MFSVVILVATKNIFNFFMNFSFKSKCAIMAHCAVSVALSMCFCDMDATSTTLAANCHHMLIVEVDV